MAEIGRREFLGRLAAGAATGLAGIRVAPSFVLILCDDIGYCDIGCFGGQAAETPNLDRLAAEGMKLTSCYAAAPIAAPSRAGLLTGRTPYRAGVYDRIPEGGHMHLPAEEKTIACLLRDAGYATCLAGTWQLNGKFNSPEQPQPGDHGFQHSFATREDPEPIARIAGEAIRWLKGVEDGKPLCLFVWLTAPRGSGSDGASMTEIDREIGRLLAALADRGLADRTLVFFTGACGPAAAEGRAGPSRGGKGSLYEGGIRVPGILRWPGRTKPGSVSDEPVIGTDVLPTLCAAAGIRVPDDRRIDGASLLPIFEGKPIARAVPLYWQYDGAIGGPQLALREGDWKLLADPVAKTLSLFNLREDPGETDERAVEETDRRKSLARKLGTLRAEVAMEGPTWPSPIPPGAKDTP